MDKRDNIPNLAQQSVLVKSDLKILEDDKEKKVIKGYDFNDGLDYDRLFDSFMTTGFQATYLGKF